MNIEPYITLAEIPPNQGLQTIFGICITIVGALVTWLFKKIDALPSRREYDAKMVAIATEIEHQDETLKEHKEATKALFNEIKAQLTASDLKMSSAIEKIQDKLEDIREHLPK
tara:strand:+ start:2415 stop:2753 length:339 start_codon:yes stop_codon:yes gene_type:complete